MAYYTEQCFLLSTLNIFHLFFLTKSKKKLSTFFTKSKKKKNYIEHIPSFFLLNLKKKMIHIDKLQLGQIVQKWDELAKNWDKLNMGQIDQHLT